ncbi:hypothetical protein [Hymenobacter terricola]|uniref:hypothetical protein n=1 Tax=Hymenobacter terricola TaxID=2819236 RepID=UPI001B308CBC|nr:hypothetical protein [Hymenobacter terricola]
MAFNGSEGSAIDISKAQEWNGNYRAAHPQPNEVYSYFFGCDILQKILKQPGCMGIRIYYGLDGSVSKLVAVGANTDEDDQIYGTFIVADDVPSGPPRSGVSNVLNS